MKAEEKVPETKRTGNTNGRTVKEINDKEKDRKERQGRKEGQAEDRKEGRQSFETCCIVVSLRPRRPSALESGW